MKDPIKAIKDAYKTLLTDSVTFSGSPIPIFIMESNIADSNYYMVLSDAKMNYNANKVIFNNEVSVTIEIFTKIKNLLTDPFNPVDVITGQVLALVLPSITTTGLSIDADFQIVTSRAENSTYLPVEDYDFGRLMKRQITFIHNIIEK